jgi:hypothetical protein
LLTTCSPSLGSPRPGGGDTSVGPAAERPPVSQRGKSA